MKWTITMASGRVVLEDHPPVILPSGALGAERCLYAPGTWASVGKEDASPLTPSDVRALQGLPRLAAPWVDGPPPAMSNEPDLDPYPGG